MSTLLATKTATSTSSSASSNSNLELRSSSALFKRAEQLKRWQESDTCAESSEAKRARQRTVQFSAGCVFLAACSAADRDEVARMVEAGADIDTANVDGLTALHQVGQCALTGQTRT